MLGLIFQRKQSMSLSGFDLLKHIAEEVTFVLKFTKDKNQDEVINDEVLLRAIVRSIEIIGEASKKLDEDFKSAHPHVEWKKMAGIRDKLIHDYFGIDYDIVWNVIAEKLPVLAVHLDEILNN